MISHLRIDSHFSSKTDPHILWLFSGHEDVEIHASMAARLVKSCSGHSLWKKKAIVKPVNAHIAYRLTIAQTSHGLGKNREKREKHTEQKAFHGCNDEL